MAATQETMTIVPSDVAVQARAPGLAVRGRIAVERLSHAGAQVGLLALMVVGSVSLFTAVPAAWLWLGSQLDGLLHLRASPDLPAAGDWDPGLDGAGREAAVLRRRAV